MRIALCFSGQPRSFRKGYEYYARNLLDKHDVDVFIHTWECDDSEDVIKWYKPVAHRIEQQLPASIDSKYTHTPNAEKWPPRFTVSALYSTFQSCLLKINREVLTRQYDWVIKTRFDFALPISIPFEHLQKQRVYMPPCRTKAFGDWLGNDQFAIGDSDTMNVYMSTYLRMDRYYNSRVEMIGEEMLRSTLNEFGRERIGYLDMPPPFPPGPHNGTPHFLIRDDYNQWTKSLKN